MSNKDHMLNTKLSFDIFFHKYTDGLVQDCSNSIANALELLQSCTKLSISWDMQLSIVAYIDEMNLVCIILHPVVVIFQ